MNRTNENSTKLAGVAAGIGSAFFFSLMVFLSKLSTGTYSPIHQLFARSVFTVGILGFYYGKQLCNLFNSEAKFLWLRSFFGGAGAAILYENIGHSSISVAILLADSTPLFVLGFECLFNRNLPTIYQLLGLCTASTGLIILSNQSLNEIKPGTINLGLLGAAFGGLAFISLKNATRRFPSGMIVFGFAVALLLISSKSIFTFPSVVEGASLKDTLTLLGLILCSIVAQLLLTWSYKALSTFSGSSLALLSSIWTIAFDALFLKTSFGVKTCLAIALVLIGILFSQFNQSSYEANPNP